MQSRAPFLFMSLPASCRRSGAGTWNILAPPLGDQSLLSDTTEKYLEPIGSSIVTLIPLTTAYDASRDRRLCPTVTSLLRPNGAIE
jgi:hypothetical protein